MTRTIIEVHALQTVPPSNLNRDDTGSPKTAIYGGVVRARVSSQAWKRAIRKDFGNTVDAKDLGWRTKRVVEKLANRIGELASDLADEAQALAIKAFKDAGIKIESKKDKESGAESHESGYLLFLSDQQYTRLAQYVVDAERSDGGWDKKALKELIKGDHSIDIALFGRMVADMSDVNVDASCQVAHAISVHGVANEFDYYTAIDDTKEDEDTVGAGMIGTVEFNSSTLYRYATVDVDALNRNLGDTDATVRAVSAFVRSFIVSMPTGKQNTFANRTVPDVVIVNLRDSQSINYAGAFEVPIAPEDKSSRVAAATEALTKYASEVDWTYDELKPLDTWVMHVGDATAAVTQLAQPMTFGELTEGVAGAVTERLAAP